jgi:hypothetical protein
MRKTPVAATLAQHARRQKMKIIQFLVAMHQAAA